LHVGSRISQLDGAVVSGIVESGAEQDEAVIMPLQDALRLTSGKVSEFLVRADGRTLDAVAAAIRRSDPALATRTVRQVAEAERSLLDRVRRLLLIVTLCVALVSAIAVGNTQSIVVLERTQEIGLLKAIGSTRRFIVTYFALEGGVIALTGGVLGLVAGIAVAEGIAAGVFGAAIPIEPAVWPVPFVVALVVSSVSGVLPVWRAAAVDAAMTLKGL
jgi:putative ABC transport system permease protein